MEYRKLPHGGEEISVLGLGTSALCSAGEEEIAKTLDLAIESGINGLDIAHYIERAEALSPDMPMIIEHLTGDAAYREAVARVQGIARAAGVAIR